MSCNEDAHHELCDSVLSASDIVAGITAKPCNCRAPSPSGGHATAPTGTSCTNCGSSLTAPTQGNAAGNTMDCLTCGHDFTPAAPWTETNAHPETSTPEAGNAD